MSDRLRWAFIHPFQLRLRRGIETYLWSLASALTKEDVDVDILTWPGKLSQPDQLGDVAIHLRAVPAVRYYQSLVAIPFYLRYLLMGRYDHVFVNFAGYGEGPALSLARSIRKVPFSLILHFPRSLVPYRYREFERWHFPERAAHLIAVSQHVADDVAAWSGRRAAVIGHGVDTHRFRPDPESRQQTRRRLSIPADASVLVTVAALEERKGIQWVIRALPDVLTSQPETHYLILGAGQYFEALADLVRSLGLRDRVHLLGEVADVAPYLSAADVGLLLSRGEASPVALLEYAAAGLPVITSRRPPFDELITSRWGELVDEEDTSHVTQTIAKLLGDGQRRDQMGTSARAEMEVHHKWRQVARQYRQLIG